MRVLFNTYPWAFDCPGGGEMQLLAYARHLPSAGVEVDLFEPWKPQFATADVVHFFSAIGGSGHFCRFARAEKRLPLVVTSSLWITGATRHAYPVEEIRWQLSQADAVVTNSEMESDALASVLDLPRDRFRAVYNGVEDAFCTPADPRAFRDAFGVWGDFVLDVGNIEPRKNQLGLARAMKGLGLPLVLIGQPRDGAYFEAVMAEGAGFVRHLGRLGHDDPLLRSAYRACSVFALPSTLETPGLAALEAAAQEARIVVTGEGSTREYFGDRVTYCDPLDDADIRRAVEDELGRPRGPGLAEHVRARFRWRRVVTDLARVYGEVAATRSTR